jgi:hypothetical protein
MPTVVLRFAVLAVRDPFFQSSVIFYFQIAVIVMNASK